MKKVSFKDIEQALENIKNDIENTRTSFSRNCSRIVGTDVYLKFENHQRTGSFKIRGALNKILSLTDEEKKKGVIASSAGNHAQGVALASTIVGTECTVVMPENSPLVKVSATQSYGGKVVLHGSKYDDSYNHARKLSEELGLAFIHPYQDEKIIAGQGTIGIEVLNEIPDLESIVVPLGGGGLISGVAIAVKELNPKCKVIGVAPALAPGMERKFNKQAYDAEFMPSIADGTSIKKPSAKMYNHFISKYVDQVVTVTESEIAQSIVFLLERAKTVVEGSGALPLAAAIHRGLDLGKKTCLILSGGNIDLNLMNMAIDRGLAKSGRVARLNVITSDKPGELNRITQVIAKLKANVLEVQHDRYSAEIAIRETLISFLLEIRNSEHLSQIVEALEESGVKVKS